MNGDTLEKFYREGLEERIIARLAKVKNLTLEQAMDLYYQSQLAQKIYEGRDDIQYLDYKVLVQILLDTEPELFACNAETEVAMQNARNKDNGSDKDDTQYLSSNPTMRKEILEGMGTPLEDCIPDSDVQW